MPESDCCAPLVEHLGDSLAGLSPELRRAGRYVLANPNEVGVSSMRQVAAAAAVKPNTLVRLARALGFDGYEAFRAPFRETLRSGRESFQDRAAWLQSVARGGSHGRLYAQMAADVLDNVEGLFSASRAEQVKTVADRIVASRLSYVVGVGTAYPLAHNFAYLAGMAIDNVVAAPRGGSVPIDDVTRIGAADVLIAISVEPYRSETVAAARYAREQGAYVVALTDGLASPIAALADQVFVTPTATPQFFPSMVAVAVLLETLVAFIVADAAPEVVANIERYHRRRFELGVYWSEESEPRRRGTGATGRRAVAHRARRRTPS